MMQRMNISELTPHPQNSYFFDDITGDAWNEFVKSIETSGIIEPIIVTQDKVIVSGHQRIRAAQQLGIDEVLVEVRAFDSEDDALRALIETNIRQRGIGNPNPVKFGRCLSELERIYGIGHGGDRKSRDHNDLLKTQKSLADELGISEPSLKRYKTIAQSIPEIQDLLESGKISVTSALEIIRHLSEEDQRIIAEKISSDDAERVTSSHIAELEQSLMQARAETDRVKLELSEERVRGIKTRKQLEDELADLREKSKKQADHQTEYAGNLAFRISELETALAEARASEPEVIEKIPDDYESAKATAARVEKEYLDLRQKSLEKDKKIKDLESQLGRDKLLRDADRDVQAFTSYTLDYIRRYGGHVWAFEQADQLSEPVRQEFVKAIKTLDAFAQQMIKNLEGNINE